MSTSSAGKLQQAHGCLQAGDIATAKRFNSKLAASLGPYPDSEIFERLQRIRAGATADASRSPKLSEFDTFASGRAEIGRNRRYLQGRRIPKASGAETAERKKRDACVPARHRRPPRANRGGSHRRDDGQLRVLQ